MTERRDYLVFNLNTSWFLTPFLKNIRSGRTGYAWIMDHEGLFLYHPENSFLGKSAFEARHERDPSISYRKSTGFRKKKCSRERRAPDGITPDGIGASRAASKN